MTQHTESRGPSNKVLVGVALAVAGGIAIQDQLTARWERARRASFDRVRKVEASTSSAVTARPRRTQPLDPAAQAALASALRGFDRLDRGAALDATVRYLGLDAADGEAFRAVAPNALLTVREAQRLRLADVRRARRATDREAALAAALTQAREARARAVARLAQLLDPRQARHAAFLEHAELWAEYLAPRA